ncbi:c-type cytochrome [Noviherbaspirillum sedimenti]|uniref:Cytochrome c5 family protein n=1 Tax=Noviherbaspirillum sedimenti TaxID=2320865 RepID=A0A3A3G8Y7_9BURK|nr:c-type cytochrome [Noviherbaspirillum sedimenti]RJG03032.1 cytochrome c5 family protein [Noviherbaspirillum sedimenti]
MKAALWIVLAGAALLAKPAAADARFPNFADPHLVKGREVWLGTCKACHATGVADAPPVHDRNAWRPRLAKGKEVLYRHALKGFFGPQSTMMPPRGGNDKLSDEEVKAAVDYMIAIVK